MDKVSTPDVLTLEEASEYLRLPVETVLRQVLKGNIPGRQIEDDWRFLKAAIDDWLRSKTVGHYPLRGMPISIADDFDEPMPELWEALGE
ncbi:MAG: helix-turn-helix domain-containing protein [Waterburya sp.]